MKHLLLSIGILLAIPFQAQAQDKPLPPPKEFKPETRQASDVLPALHLPEYVITGSDMISFTEDRKSAVDDPDSQEFTARAGRGEREQRFFDTSPTRMPLRKPLLTGSEEVFRFKGGYGSFGTPHVQLWYGDRYQLGDAAAHVLYERSDGHVPQADYTRFGFDIAGGTYLPKSMPLILTSSRLQAEFHADVQSYGLYADKLERFTPALDFQRNLSEYAGRIDLISRKNPIVDHELSFLIGTTVLSEELGVLDTLQLAEYRTAETRIGLDAKARFLTSLFPIDARLAMHVNDLSDSDEEAYRPFYMRGAASSRFELSEDVWLLGEASLYLFRGSDHATQLRLYPSLTVQYLFNEDWSVHAGYVPVVREQTFSAFRKINPYLMLASEIRHTDIPLRIEAGAAFDNRKSTAGRLLLSYSASSNWSRFSLLPDPVRQQWEILYNGLTSIGELQGDLSHAFSSRTRMQSTALFRVSGNDAFDGSIPYLPDYELRFLLSHDFPFDLSLQTTVQLVGERSSGESADLAAWMILGLQLEYRFAKNAGVFLQFDNVLDQSYQSWSGYRERPFFVMGGVTIRF
jgi:hypothetical protein